MSTKSVCGISCGEMHKFASVLDKAGFNADLVRKIVNSRDNKHAKAMYVAITDKNKIIETNQYIKRLSGDTPIIIPACDGSHIIAEAKKVFKYCIDPDFKKWGLDERGNPTKETAVVVHEIVRDGTFARMFGSFGVDLDKLCFTQHQVEAFCENHPDWLCIDGYGTFFLIKKDWKYSATIGNLFVARVRARSDGLDVYARRFEHDSVWYADCQHRLVVPQLET